MPFSRRDLFRLAWRSPQPEPSSPAVAPRLRPPGAVPESEFLRRCTRCDACIEACPHDAIRRTGSELGPEQQGTPVILALEQPCWMCRDLPCIPACEPGALAPLDAPEGARMGTIHMRLEACFSAQGNPCDVCAERCPVRPRAITVGFREAPRVDAPACTGCGVCAWLCPAHAIDVRPRS